MGQATHFSNISYDPFYNIHTKQYIDNSEHVSSLQNNVTGENLLLKSNEDELNAVIDGNGFEKE